MRLRLSTLMKGYTPTPRTLTDAPSSCLAAPAVHAPAPSPSTPVTVNGGATGREALPFKGQGYFDGDLDAWVGLDKDGHVGTCQVVSRSSTTTVGAIAMQQQLDWKMAKDKLWSEGQQAADHGPTLTAMGSARFCLVDCDKGMEFHSMAACSESPRFALGTAARESWRSSTAAPGPVRCLSTSGLSHPLRSGCNAVYLA